MAPRIPKQNTRFINPQAESLRGRSALEAMRGYVGAPSQASVMYPGTQRGYEAGELAGMAEMLIPGASLAKGALGAALAGVIKPRGGNWLAGSVENTLGGLRKYSGSNEREAFRGLASNLEKELMDLNQQRAATLDQLRAKGQPDSVINLVDAEFTGKIDQVNQSLSGILEELAKLDRNTSLNRWIEGPLTKYIKRDMATEQDPVRALAEQGILHFEPDMRYVDSVKSMRKYPFNEDYQVIGKRPLAKEWERTADQFVNVVSPEEVKRYPELGIENSPWVENLPEDSRLYAVSSGIRYHPDTGRKIVPTSDPGFGHLIDELNNALNPESGLPRNLLLRPEQMQQMGMEKAVRHVDAINKWRAAQKAAADAEIANKAMVLREYPDTPEMPNPKGLRWMELGKDTPDLEKQLKYEGDTMGHCVGGYCPDVLEGNSRIFSLRDAKGEPHVTVEVGKYNAEDLDSYTFAELVGDQERGFKILDEFTDSNMDEFGDFDEFLRKRYPEIASKVPYGHRIKQIKGKQNLAPKDEYLPFVQDFVRNSPLGAGWSRVGDLENTNLVDISGFPKRVEALGSRYVTEKELNDYLDKFGDGNGMADGGMVAQPGYFDDLDAFLRR